MKHRCFIVLLIIAGSAYAQQNAFQPPIPHDVQRYEAGWDKNPFTLKTVAPVVESISFAKDLAIGTYYGDSANPTIIIANTKTNERIRLIQGQPSASGMKISTIRMGSSRKDVEVEVTLGTETAVIRYNDDYVKQMAAAEMTKAPATQQQTRSQTGTPSSIRLPHNPVPPGKGAAPTTAQASPVAPEQPDIGSPSAAPNAANPPPIKGSSAGATALVSQAVSVNGAIPLSARRRLVAPTPKATIISQ